ncbi:MAG: hypothetical protein Q9160_002864 [Pyrenula sp. 1 TL-2023]
MAAQNIGDAPAKTFAELLSGPLVDIFVGSDKRHWALHRNLLAYHSHYFSTELNGNAGKAAVKSGQIELQDVEPAAFELLVKWLYQGKIDDVSNIPLERKWDYAEACQNLYLLCDKIQLLQLKNIAIDQFRKGCNEAGLVPAPEEMKPVYEKTLPSSPFRNLVSRIAARQIMDPENEKDVTSYRECFESHPDFAIDVICAIKHGSGSMLYDDPTEGDNCLFHEHQNGDKCGRIKKRKG